MRKFMFAVLALVGAWQLSAAASAGEQSRGTELGGDGVSGRVMPVRDADQPQEPIASGPADIAERAESKLVNHAESQRDAANSALASIPLNDNCVNSTAISGQGAFNFDNAMATLDGGAHVSCTDPLDPIGTMEHDVWYCWTSPCTGPVVIQTCNQTSVDTKLAVYGGCACPATNANLLGCNDDGCGMGSFLQSRRTFLAEMNQSYLIRLGTYPGGIGDPGTPADDIPPAPGGVGSFSLTCLNLPCTQGGVNCQRIKPSAGSLSNQVNSLVADNFKPTSSGTITNVCWWGSYSSDNPPVVDNFRIRYFTNNASNLPGTAINVTPFQQGANLTVSGPVETVIVGAVFPIFEYSATHTGIPVSVGQTYWVEISNLIIGDNWYWQQGFGEDRLSLQDGAKPDQLSDPIDGYTAADSVNNDMAFCAGVPIVQPPSTTPCLTATNSCCAASSTERGCNNRTCCEAVCTCDPFCCNVTWDILCATVGLDPSCGVQVVCPGLCVGCPDGTIDCNANGIPDDCEIEQGVAFDCNSDGVLDECETDSDGDTVPNSCDICPGGDDRLDMDTDGAPDDCDGCPNDPAKTSPGLCGCGLLDAGDSDADGVLDCVDQCPGVADSDFARGCAGAIPSASAWGLLVLSLMLLVAAKVAFPIRHPLA